MAADNVVSTREEETFDILDCGPRRRFVVLGDQGPFFVHNCTQFLARVLLGQAIARMRARGLRILLTVHDDVYILVEHDEHASETLKIAETEMTRVPAWMPDLPLACEGKLMTSLGDDYV